MTTKAAGLLLVALAAVALAVAGDTALDCSLPENDSQVFPNPANCSTYFICSRGNPVMMDCPPGLIWNSDVSACDFPWNFECHDQPPVKKIPEEADTSSEEEEDDFDDSNEERFMDVFDEISPSTCTIEANYTNFPNPYNCSQFYECDNGVAHLVDCPPGLHFNAELGVCDFVWHANCTEQSVSTTDIPSTSEDSLSEKSLYAAPPTCPPPGSGGDILHFPNADNCTTYWICDNGKATLLACPNGLVYNPAIGACDFQWALNCTGTCCPNKRTPLVKELKEAPSRVAPTSTFAAPPTCPPPGSGGDILHFPNADNCTTYWICDNGKATLLACPNGLVYNPPIGACDFQWALNCTGTCCPNKRTPLVKELKEAPSRAAPISTFAAPPTCPPPGSGEDILHFPNADNCTTYWICDNGKATLLACPNGLVYNPPIEACDFPWALNCTGTCCPNKDSPTVVIKEVPVEVNAVSPVAAPTCPPPGSGGDILHFPNADNCTTYWICDNGKATLLACPNGLVYNPAVGACDFQWALNCTGVCCPNKVAPRTQVTCPKDPVDVVHIPNPDDCTTFFKCNVDEIPILMHCPAGLEFNPELLVCDYPENANCSVQRKHSKYLRRPL